MGVVMSLDFDTCAKTLPLKSCAISGYSGFLSRKNADEVGFRI